MTNAIDFAAFGTEIVTQIIQRMSFDSWKVSVKGKDVIPPFAELALGSRFG